MMLEIVQITCPIDATTAYISLGGTGFPIDREQIQILIMRLEGALTVIRRNQELDHAKKVRAISIGEAK